EAERGRLAFGRAQQPARGSAPAATLCRTGAAAAEDRSPDSGTAAGAGAAAARDLRAARSRAGAVRRAGGALRSECPRAVAGAARTGAGRSLRGARRKDLSAPVRRREMANYLVVVESPAKAKTIRKYLGPDYTVRASLGHVKDLPKRKLGVDP